MAHRMRVSLLALVLLLAALPAAAQVPDDVTTGDFMESRYAVITETSTDREKVHQGGEFTLALRMTPFHNETLEFHMYGIQQTGNPNYMASVLSMDDAPGIEWTINFPTGENTPDNGGDMFVLHGQQVATITGKVASDAAVGDRTVTGKFLFNTCTEDMCLPPSQLELSWEIEVVPADYTEPIEVVGYESLVGPTDVPETAWKLPDPQAPVDSGAPIVAGGESGGVELGELKPQGGGDTLTLWSALLFAFLGGLILNVMPCVLPVVSIKVISLARHAQEDPQTVVRQGLVFCLGIIATFLALALVVNLIQATGAELGWGFQFQNPWFLIIMSTVIFAFGLSLAGVYTIKPPSRLTDAGEKLSEKEGYSGSFFKGVLATVLGTPCVGPFLGPALGFAFTRSPFEVWAIFFAVGLGMAIPYALLVSNPKFLQMGQRERGKLTRSIMDAKGWLVDFERVMAFVLFATVLYLLYILAGSMGGQAVIWALAFLLGVAFALWLWGRLISTGRRSGIGIGLVAGPVIIALSAWLFLPNVRPPAAEAATGDGHLPWVEYDATELSRHLGEGRTVLVDFTADWCPNCKTNEAVALNVPETAALMEELDVVPMLADWTAMDDEIGTMIRRLGRASIPLTAIFPADSPNEPILLDGLYTAPRLHEELRRATD